MRHAFMSYVVGLTPPNLDEQGLPHARRKHGDSVVGCEMYQKIRV
jgi:hypothetical protein